jgi:hypothetical protein
MTLRCLSANDLAPEDRFKELASILALGVIRRRQRLALGSTGSPQNPAEISPARLEISDDTVLSVTNPVNGRESPILGAPA